MASPMQLPYSYLKCCEIPLNGKPYGFWTLVSNDGVIAWMPDTEQQHVNPQYRDPDRSVAVLLGELNELDVARMLQQIQRFQTKITMPLEDILSKHRPLIEKILDDSKKQSIQV